MSHRMAQWSLPVALAMLAFVTGSVFTQETFAQQSGRGRDAARGRAAGDQRERAPEARAAKDEAEEPERRSVRAEVTVFTVKLDEAKLVELDAVALAAAADTPGALRSALGAFGTVDTLYRLDQRTLAPGRNSQAKLLRDVPYVTGRHTGKDGQTSNAVRRSNVGTSIQFDVSLDDDGQRAHASISIDISMVTASAVAVGEDVLAPVFWQVQQNWSGTSALGTPIVVVGADAANSSESQEAYAYITLVRFSE